MSSEPSQSSNLFRNHTPPKQDEAEISVFGPGYGESIVVHIGGGTWVIVDSCINQRTGIASAIDYLDHLGVASEDVACIVATHWHDDHIRGLSQVVNRYSKALFVCSDALKSSEFLELVSIYMERPMMKSTGVSEFIRIFQVLSETGRHPKWAIAGRPLFEQDVELARGSLVSARIIALSPSDKAVTLSKLEMGKLLPGEYAPKQAIVFRGPNDFSVASAISIGNASVLLGADLEVSPDPLLGWRSVLNDWPTKSPRSGVFKIPHHGSANAYSVEVEDRLLTEQPISVVTPYRNGRVTLPRQTDIQRIVRGNGTAFITSDPESPGKRRRHPSVQKMVLRTVKSIRYAQPPPGHVRIRGKIGADATDWSVELYGSAWDLTELAEARSAQDRLSP